MVIDSSAILTILLEEADASEYAAAIADDPIRLMSAATLLEVSIVLIRRRSGDTEAALGALLARFPIIVVPFDREQMVIAREAFRIFGKGMHAAGLNYGDCFSYALARQRSEPLLFKGNDFSQTDVEIA